MFSATVGAAGRLSPAGRQAKMRGMHGTRTPRGPLERLDAMLRRGHGRGLRKLARAQIEELPHLYRFASSELARVETQAGDPARAHYLRRLVGRAHGVLYRDLESAGRPLARRFVELFFVESPRAIRGEWKLLLALFGTFYGLAALAFVGVATDLELAFSLQPAAAVTEEIRQLRETEAGLPFRGNFTFGAAKSPFASGTLMAHNIFVSVLFFGSGLVPPLFLLVLGSNALMLGTYLGVASHWDQAGAISSILFCHGTIELQMIVLAGAAGLVLARGVIAPGPWTRRHALRNEAHTAWRMFAPIFPLLAISGFIEGFISPHAPLGVRVATAVATGALLVVWALGGRLPSRSRAAPTLVEPSGQ